MHDIDAPTVRAVMRAQRICVLIPTYNNAGTLGEILSGVLLYCDDVIVVNDGSTDATASIIDGFGDSIDAIQYAGNRGKGHALRTGLRHAATRGFSYAITLDSDGQHRSTDIPAFVHAIVSHPGALIVGARDLSRVDINGKSTFANRFSNFWFYMQTGRRLPDTQTGFRAYPLDRLHGLSLMTSRYEAELGLLVFASWHGRQIVSIPIDVYYPPRDERISHFRPAADFARISVLNTLLCVAAVVYGLPLRLWHALRVRRWFGGEFRPFTRRHGTRREVSVTLGRLTRSLYGLLFITFWSWLIVTPLTWIYFATGRDSARKRMRYHRILCRLTRFICDKLPGSEVTFENVDSPLFDTPAVLICNHQSILDLPVLMSADPRLIFVTNDRSWHNPLYSAIIHRAGFQPASQGIDALIESLRRLTAEGYTIAIFPEGTRSDDNSIHRFHKGAFHIARELGMDIITAVIHGAGDYLPKTDIMFRRGPITLRIEGRAPSSQTSQMTLRRMASHFQQQVTDCYAAMSARLRTAQFFAPYARYKFAWHGWRTVSLSKRELRRLPSLAHIINAPRTTGCVRITDAGMGALAIIYAMVHPTVEVYAFISVTEDFEMANKPVAPPNLHFVHAVWPTEYEPAGVVFDETISFKPISDNERR